MAVLLGRIFLLGRIVRVGSLGRLVDRGLGQVGTMAVVWDECLDKA